MLSPADLKSLAPFLNRDGMAWFLASALQSRNPDLRRMLGLLWMLSNGYTTTDDSWAGSRATICRDYAGLLGIRIREQQPQTDFRLAIDALLSCPVLESWSLASISANCDRVFRTLPLIGTACLQYHRSWEHPHFREMLLVNFRLPLEKVILADYHHLCLEYKGERGHPPSRNLDEIMFVLACWVSSSPLEEIRQIPIDVWEIWLTRLYKTVPDTSVHRILEMVQCRTGNPQLRRDRAVTLIGSLP